MSVMRELYTKKVVPTLMKTFGYKNRMQVPRLKKVVVHVGAGEASQDAKQIEPVVKDLSMITGQRPVISKARKAISNFRLRKGMTVGAKVTLRGERAYHFLERFFNFAAPQIRDFRGFPENSFDGRGGYTLGIKEQLIFPEIERDKVKKVFGMDITIVTTAERDDEARALLENLGMPFRKE
ncbi:50S ribosomal protein L5 [candidate division WOR-3 bacterium]|uniref:Large ribosomal subunit protein uL5 n=1 Tax=candidate division WOR-3 bacterium TaxID=2052148 RepID=A0A9D5K7Z4_UNCW3|nr:50S ribosomal protein L5 [candidate division WOR-3 bacterium]MBD3363800.1 50S ribosomal protein L5 [candidate division WOR-3 bacterium]